MHESCFAQIASTLDSPAALAIPFPSSLLQSLDICKRKLLSLSDHCSAACVGRCAQPILCLSAQTTAVCVCVCVCARCVCVCVCACALSRRECECVCGRPVRRQTDTCVCALVSDQSSLHADYVGNSGVASQVSRACSTSPCA